MDPTTCYFCSERIEPGTAKCPSCGVIIFFLMRPHVGAALHRAEAARA